MSLLSDLMIKAILTLCHHSALNGAQNVPKQPTEPANSD